SIRTARRAGARRGGHACRDASRWVLRPSPQGEKRERALAPIRMTGFFGAGRADTGSAPTGCDSRVAGRVDRLRAGYCGVSVRGQWCGAAARRPVRAEGCPDIALRAMGPTPCRPHRLGTPGKIRKMVPRSTLRGGSFLDDGLRAAYASAKFQLAMFQ